VGQTVKVQVWRDGKSTDLTVTVGAYQAGGSSRPARRVPVVPKAPAP
jgi:hypothetical protein